jgi:hypothetical protein
VGSFGSASPKTTSISSIFFGASETDAARYLVWYACGQGENTTSDGNAPLSEDLYLVGDFNSWEKQEDYKFVWDAQQNLYTITNVTVPNSWMRISSTNDVYSYGPVEDGKVMGTGEIINVKAATGNWNLNETAQNSNVKFSLANMTVYIGAS